MDDNDKNNNLTGSVPNSNSAAPADWGSPNIPSGPAVPPSSGYNTQQQSNISVPVDVPVNMGGSPESFVQRPMDASQPLQVPIASTVEEPSTSSSIMPVQEPGHASMANPEASAQPQTTAAQQEPTSTQLPSSLGSESITTRGRNGIRGFKLFMSLAIIIIVVIWGIVFYMYFNNQKNKSDDQNSAVVDNQNSELPEEIPTEIEKPNSDQIKIVNGNVVWENSSGQLVLVSKNDYPQTGITGFARAVLSPDQNNICFESWPPAPEPALYIYNLDSSETKEVSPNRKNCVWTFESNKIIYKNSASSTQSIDIFSFDLATSQESNLTNTSSLEVARRYEIVGLSSDGSKVVCNFEEAGSETGQQDCELRFE